MGWTLQYVNPNFLDKLHLAIEKAQRQPQAKMLEAVFGFYLSVITFCLSDMHIGHKGAEVGVFALADADIVDVSNLASHHSLDYDVASGRGEDWTCRDLDL